MLSMLDEAIADLRAARGSGRFDLTLSALRRSARRSSSRCCRRRRRRKRSSRCSPPRARWTLRAERTSLLATALATIDRDKSALPAEWAAATRADATDAMRVELSLDRSYQALTARTMAAAELARPDGGRHAGSSGCCTPIQRRDAALGAQAPGRGQRARRRGRSEARRRAAAPAGARSLGAARARRCARYRVAIGAPMDLLHGAASRRSKTSRSLAGSPPTALSLIQRRGGADPER